MHIDDALEIAAESDTDVAFATGLEAAFIGLGKQCHKMLAVYDTCRAVATFEQDLMEACEIKGHEECDHQAEAWEWFDFNVAGAWVGEGTPIFVEACATEID